MSTLVENVAKVTAAHAALKTAISSKGVAVPDGTKLTDMPALVEQISTEPVPTNPRAVFAYDKSTSIVVPKTLVVDMLATDDIEYCFSNCNYLTSITLPDGFGQNATSLRECFNRCYRLKTLTLPDGFGQNATSLYFCFFGCTDIKTLTLPAGFGQNAINSAVCFYDCKNITSLTLPAGFGQNATDFQQCFQGCISLTTLHLPDGFGQKAKKLDYCFKSCTSLTTITGNPNFKVSLDLSASKNLTHDSIMVIINGLQTVTEAQTLTLGTENLAKLTDDEKKVATDKGWTLA